MHETEGHGSWGVNLITCTKLTETKTKLTDSKETNLTVTVPCLVQWFYHFATGLWQWND